ncbi:hypothetical protein BCR43DRAFT_499268, partial [Syncephalastrum racemosum]
MVSLCYAHTGPSLLTGAQKSNKVVLVCALSSLSMLSDGINHDIFLPLFALDPFRKFPGPASFHCPRHRYRLEVNHVIQYKYSISICSHTHRS